MFALCLASGVSGYLTDFNRDLITNFRLPRTTMAMISGGLLGVAGAVTQNLFRNPLASPSIIGVEAGGSLAVTALLVAGIAPQFAPLGALSGAMISLLFIVSFREKSSIILGGLALTTVAGSLGSLLLSIALSDPARSGQILQWLMGSLAGRAWTDLWRALPLAAAGTILAWRTGPALDTLLLGPHVARTVGLDVSRTTRLAVTAVALLTAAAITSGGLLPFTGLVAPHLARATTGGRSLPLKTNQLAFRSFFIGAILVMVSDLIARTAAGARELETGVITGVVGGPFFLWCVYRQHSRETTGVRP
jgi:iron complex transport system permease protein